MTDPTTPEAAPRAPGPHEAAPPNLRRRRRNRAVRPPLAAAKALARLAMHGDVYKVGGLHYLVAPIDDDSLDTVIGAGRRRGP